MLNQAKRPMRTALILLFFSSCFHQIEFIIIPILSWLQASRTNTRFFANKKSLFPRFSEIKIRVGNSENIIFKRFANNFHPEVILREKEAMFPSTQFFSYFALLSSSIYYLEYAMFKCQARKRTKNEIKHERNEKWKNLFF